MWGFRVWVCRDRSLEGFRGFGLKAGLMGVGPEGRKNFGPSSVASREAKTLRRAVSVSTKNWLPLSTTLKTHCLRAHDYKHTYPKCIKAPVSKLCPHPPEP